MAHRVDVTLLARTPVGKLARAIPGLEGAYRSFVWSRPNRYNQFDGVFESRNAAVDARPEAFAKEGWDHADITAADYFQPSLFASLFWLGQVMKPGFRVVDVGGSVGNTYYALTKRVAMPEGASWHVVEVPAVAERGRQLAEARGAKGLTFGSRIEDAGACDLLFSAGCLQYTDLEIGDLLAALPALPRYVLINKLPLAAGKEFWTLQNLGNSVSPYRVYNEGEFLAAFAKRGYRLRDRWPVQELKLEIPFHPELYLREKAGLLLELN